MTDVIQSLNATKPAVNPALPLAAAERSVQLRLTAAEDPGALTVILGKVASPPPTDTGDFSGIYQFPVSSADQLTSRLSGSDFAVVVTTVVTGGSGWVAGDNIYVGLYLTADSPPQTLLAVAGPYPVA